MKLKLLIVEDDEEALDNMRGSLANISELNQRRYGIEAIDIDIAEWASEARRLLDEAAKRGRLYDILLLDLRLPEDKGGTLSETRGIEVLKHAKKAGAAKQILIYSILDQYYHAVDALKGGADDFINKIVTGEELVARVLSSGVRLLSKESDRILEQRLRDLVPYAERGLAHRLGTCFSRFVQSVVNETEALEDAFKERWGLDVEKDSNVPQVGHLIAVDDAVRSAKREWTEILSSLIKADESPGVCVVEDLLSGIKNDLLPCLAVKRLELAGTLSGTTRVRTFHDRVDDVQVVQREIILGALSELPDRTDAKRHIEVSVSRNGDRAEVRFEDNLPPIGAHSDSINKGMSVPPEPDFGRAWGLSVAQHVALRGGGRINVTSTEWGNAITYSIPIADHA